MIVWSQSNNGGRAHAFILDTLPTGNDWWTMRALCGRLLDVSPGLVEIAADYPHCQTCEKDKAATNPMGK